jgi:hypothetical protein
MTAPSEKQRPGNKSLENTVRTDERYGKDGLWLGPRGRDYGALLEHPKPYQIANLYPDQNSSYWIAFLDLPPGSVMTLRGRFPYARYCQFALYRPDPLGNYTATNEALVDHEIRPAKGSTNPFKPGASRLGARRSYTIHIVAEDAPARRKSRKPNTMYAGKAGKIQMVYRVYLPDVGRDGSGDTGLPEYDVTLANGKRLSAAEVRRKLNKPVTKGIPPGMTVEKWRALCSAPDNDPELKPESTPARNPPVVERYFNNEYNLIGAFKRPKDRAKIDATIATGFGGDPMTLFMFAFVSRCFGPVLVLRGKMPRFPDTFQDKKGKGLAKMTDWECRYWSVIMSEAPPSGMGTDALTDMQVPLDKDRNYTIVVSRAEDRPANATLENGIAWLDWGTRGEGIDDPSNREDFGFLVFRFMYNNPRWKHSPTRITVPGSEPEVMGPYYPRGEYTDRATFEAGDDARGAELPCFVCPFATDLVRTLVRPGDRAAARGADSLARGFEDLLQTLSRQARLPGLAAGAAGQLQAQIGRLRGAISTIRASTDLRSQLPCLVCPFSTDVVRGLVHSGRQVVAGAAGAALGGVERLLEGVLRRAEAPPQPPVPPRRLSGGAKPARSRAKGARRPRRAAARSTGKRTSSARR